MNLIFIFIAILSLSLHALIQLFVCRVHLWALALGPCISYAHTLDRNRYSAAISCSFGRMMHQQMNSPMPWRWTQSLGKFLKLSPKVGCGRQMNSPRPHGPWVAFKVAEENEIGAEFDGPLAGTIRMIESQWEKLGHTPHHVQEDINVWWNFRGFHPFRDSSSPSPQGQGKNDSVKSKRNMRETFSACMRIGRHRRVKMFMSS